MYLNAIKTISALADIFPQEIIPSLFSIYASSCANQPCPSDAFERSKYGDDITFRLRIGESLLQTVQRLGSALDIMIEPILKNIFHVIRDEPDKDLKASSLSILSVIAETSAMSLRFDLIHVVRYCHDCVMLEEHVSMRRGMSS